jgi:UDP-N-acetylmuramate dehydrogenase
MISKNVSLKDFSNYKIGGKASYFFEAKTKDEIVKVIKEWDILSKNFPQKSKKIFILGGGTNIIFSDNGFEGLVIKDSIQGIEKNNEEVLVGAGVSVGDLLNFCIENSLSGLEWAGGLPGTVGGAVRGNAGAFAGETKDNLLEVESLNTKTLETKKRNNKDCLFSYRNSVFKQDATDELITFIKFKLILGDKEEITQKTSEKIEYRKQRHPLEYPNIGSIFKNVPVQNVPEKFKQELSQYIKDDPFPVIPSAKLIFLAGLKGKRVGNVMVSEKHTNFIINLGDGKASEVLELIKSVKQKVNEIYGIVLEEEVMYVGGDLNE